MLKPRCLDFLSELSIHDYDYRKSQTVAIIIQCTEVRFASFLLCEFTTIAVRNPPVRKVAKRTSVQCLNPHHILMAAQCTHIYISIYLLPTLRLLGKHYLL